MAKVRVSLDPLGTSWPELTELQWLKLDRAVPDGAEGGHPGRVCDQAIVLGATNGWDLVRILLNKRK